MSQHQDFILSPLSSIIEDAIRVLPPLNSGIEKRELSGYVLQSLFLKATGFQEQKMKCVAWEMATVDYSYRFDEFKKIFQNECSTLQSKQDILEEVVSQIHINEPGFKGFADSILDAIIAKAYQSVCLLYTHTMLHAWNQRNENDFEKLHDEFKPEYIIANNSCAAHKVFSPTPVVYNGKKCSYYSFVYEQRNRCAHNTLSYQQNLPSLSSLENRPFASDNYYILLFILLILDQYVVEIYKKFLEVTGGCE